MGSAIVMIGYLIAFVGSIWLAIIAFQESILWGLGCLFLPIVGLVFAILHWEEAKTPFLTSLGGLSWPPSGRP